MLVGQLLKIVACKVIPVRVLFCQNQVWTNKDYDALILIGYVVMCRDPLRNQRVYV